MADEKKPRASGRLIVPSAALIVFALDFFSKRWARDNLIAGAVAPFLPGFIQFRLVHNTGAAFSLGSENGMLMQFVASVMTLALVAWAVHREAAQKESGTLDRIGLGCLIGGAAGNLCDRFLFGRVTDFLEFTFFNFPVFNAADVLIDAGIGLMIIGSMLHKEQRQPVPKDNG